MVLGVGLLGSVFLIQAVGNQGITINDVTLYRSGSNVWSIGSDDSFSNTVFSNITSPTFVNFILSKVNTSSNLTASDIWNYETRTLTNLDDTRANKIDNLDTTISSRLAASDYVTERGTDNAALASVWTATRGGYIDTIKASTDNIASIKSATDDLLDGGRIDLLIDDIKTHADYIPSTIGTSLGYIPSTLTADLASILADTNELQTDWVNGGRLDLILDSISITANKYIGFTPLISQTQATPVQNQWYNIANDSSAGVLYFVTLSNNGAGSKNWDIEIILDGYTVSKTGQAINSGVIEYFCITPRSDTLSASASEKYILTPSLADSMGTPLYYKSSLVINIRETSSTPYSFTATVRRCVA